MQGVHRPLQFMLVFRLKVLFIIELSLVILLVLFQKSAYSEEEIRRDAKVAMDYCEMANALACLLVDTEHFDEAEPLHREVLELSKKYAKIGRIIYSPC